MACIEFPISLPGFRVTEVRKQDRLIEIYAASIRVGAKCPDCGSRSRRVHSYYERSAADFPISAHCVRLHLTVKRFRCQTEGCARATFVETFPNLLARNARRTNRLHKALETIAFSLGGQAGSRLAWKLQMPTSGDSLLRLIRKTEVSAPEEPKVIGVDDWAKRRGRVYGTILVDLERHQVIELLTDRTAETLAQWLRAHPGIKVVARDRSGEYARGVSAGAPQAKQVTDRWHLFVNLREAFERMLDRLRPELDPIVPAKSSARLVQIPIRRRRPRSPGTELARQADQERRQGLYTEIHRLQAAGHSIRAIARQLEKSPTTIYQYLAMPEFPQKIARKRISSRLDPYGEYLSQRWQAGCRNARQLWREIRQKGYGGTYRQVSRWAYERRERPAPTTPRKHLRENEQGQFELRLIRRPPEKQHLPVARRLVWLFMQPVEKLETEEAELRMRLTNHPTLAEALTLTQDFQGMLRERNASEFEAWLKACVTSKIPEFVNLAQGMKKDKQAIKAALGLNWSNGQTEGQINRLKLLKRQMYGRAKFDLLRLRFLHPT